MLEHDPYATDKLEPIKGLEVEDDDGKIEAAIMQQPEDIRAGLRNEWQNYKSTLNNIPTTSVILVDMIAQRFFDSVLKGQSISYDELRSSFKDRASMPPSSEAGSAQSVRVTQPVVGIDQNRESHNAIIVEPGEDKKL